MKILLVKTLGNRGRTSASRDDIIEMLNNAENAMNELIELNENDVTMNENLSDEDTTSSKQEVRTIEIDHNWDSIEVKKLNIHYVHFGEYDKRMFSPPNLGMLYTAAISGPDSNKWLTAIQKELAAFDR